MVACHTNDSQLAEHVRCLRKHGRQQTLLSTKRWEGTAVGAIHAGHCRVKMNYIEDWNANVSSAPMPMI